MLLKFYYQIKASSAYTQHLFNDHIKSTSGTRKAPPSCTPHKAGLTAIPTQPLKIFKCTGTPINRETNKRPVDPISKADPTANRYMPRDFGFLICLYAPFNELLGQQKSWFFIAANIRRVIHSIRGIKACLRMSSAKRSLKDKPHFLFKKRPCRGMGTSKVNIQPHGAE